MTDIINRGDVERLLPLCQQLWPTIKQHPPGSAGRAAITSTLDNMPAADRHICDLLLDRMERVIQFEDAWFPFYQGELDTITTPKKACSGSVANTIATFATGGNCRGAGSTPMTTQ